jgi:hypothetical protein
MFLLRAIDRGDRRKQAAQRNAKKSEEERFTRIRAGKGCGDFAHPAACVGRNRTGQHGEPDSAFARRGRDARADLKTTPALGPGARALMRDPRTGNLLSPEGRVLSREEEEQLLYPDWPHISPHLKKENRAGAYIGLNVGESAGLKSPAPETQVVDSTRDFRSKNFSRKNQLSGVDNRAEISRQNSNFDPDPPLVGDRQ